MIDYKILIDGVDYTNSCALPFKEQYVLDSALDNGTMQLFMIPRKEQFKPHTPMVITRANETYTFDIFNDKVTEIIGTGLYTHDLVLIEETKKLEKKIVDTNTTTQPIFHDYYSAQKNAGVDSVKVTLAGTTTQFYYNSLVKSIYLDTEMPFTLPSIANFIKDSPAAFPILSGINYFTSIKVFNIDDEIVAHTPYDPAVGDASINGYNVTLSLNNLENEVYKVVYYISQQGATNQLTETFYFSIINQAEGIQTSRLKSITDVINRLLAITETQRASQTPALIFNQEQATFYGQRNEDGEPIYPAPEFSMTKSTLRECLDQIGGYIHSIVRLQGNVIYFDKLGGNVETILPDDYIGHYETLDSEQYASQLDSIVDNLVNIDDSKQGTITEPFARGYETVRASGTIRIGDGDGATSIIETEYPIEKIEKLICGYIKIGDEDIQVGDITPYVYERTEYLTLSSIANNFPYSKGYALTYTQGQNNISGLTFKLPNAVSSIFSKQAIVNILERVTGRTLQSLFTVQKITELNFQIIYYPSTTARIKQSKDNLNDYDQELTSIYNQSANKVDSRAYGENLKGAIARLGNIEKFITFNIKPPKALPEVGNYVIIDNEDYYIATMNVENLTDYIKITCGLSKDFNALSKYIGIKNNIRLYEVSERQSVERFVSYEDYCVIGNTIESDNLELLTTQAIKNKINQFNGAINVYLIGIGAKYKGLIGLSLTDGGEEITPIFNTRYKIVGNSTGNEEYDIYIGIINIWNGNIYDMYTESDKDYVPKQAISVARLKGFDIDNNALQQVDLPIFSLGIGNSIWLGCRYRDNYSAGNTSEEPPELKSNDYYRVQNYVPYGDAYGELETLEIKMYDYLDYITTTEKALEVGNALPKSDLTATRTSLLDTNGDNLVIKKDSRENINLSYQCHFVTNQKGIVIGSQLAQGSPMVSNFITSSASLYILPNRVNKFATRIDLTNAILVKNYNGNLTDITANGNVITFANETANGSGKCWLLVDNATNKLLFGKNIIIENGDTIEMPKMTFTHKVIKED